MSADKYLSLDGATGLVKEEEATDSSSGGPNAGDIVALDSGGKLDHSVMPNGIGDDALQITAGENLSAGDFVNIYDNSGAANCRKADASDPAKQAHGFVNAAVSQSSKAKVFFEGTNTQLSSLSIGTEYALSDSVPGAVVKLSSGPTTAGHILQPVGVATSDSSINIEIQKPTVRG